MSEKTLARLEIAHENLNNKLKQLSSKKISVSTSFNKNHSINDLESPARPNIDSEESQKQRLPSAYVSRHRKHQSTIYQLSEQKATTPKRNLFNNNNSFSDLVQSTKSVDNKSYQTPRKIIEQKNAFPLEKFNKMYSEIVNKYGSSNLLT